MFFFSHTSVSVFSFASLSFVLFYFKCWYEVQRLNNKNKHKIPTRSKHSRSLSLSLSLLFLFQNWCSIYCYLKHSSIVDLFHFIYFTVFISSEISVPKNKRNKVSLLFHYRFCFILLYSLFFFSPPSPAPFSHPFIFFIINSFDLFMLFLSLIYLYHFCTFLLSHYI